MPVSVFELFGKNAPFHQLFFSIAWLWVSIQSNLFGDLGPAPQRIHHTSFGFMWRNVPNNITPECCGADFISAWWQGNKNPTGAFLALQSPRSGLNWKENNRAPTYPTWIKSFNKNVVWKMIKSLWPSICICNKPRVICKNVAFAASWLKWIHVGMFLGSMVTLGWFLTFVTPSYPMLQVGSLWRVCTHMLVPEPLPHGKNRRSSVLAGFLPSKVWRFFVRSLLQMFCLFMMGIHIMITRFPSNSEMTSCLHFQEYSSDI